MDTLPRDFVAPVAARVLFVLLPPVDTEPETAAGPPGNLLAGGTETAAEFPVALFDTFADVPDFPVDALADAPAEPVDVDAGAPFDPIDTVADELVEPVDTIADVPGELTETPAEGLPDEPVEPPPEGLLDEPVETPAGGLLDELVETATEVPGPPVETFTEVPEPPPVDTCTPGTVGVPTLVPPIPPAAEARGVDTRDAVSTATDASAMTETRRLRRKIARL